MDRKAISHHHRMSGFPTPTAAEGVRQTFAGLRNQAQPGRRRRTLYVGAGAVARFYGGGEGERAGRRYISP